MNSAIIHDKVISEYERIRNENRINTQRMRDELYLQIPSIKEIDDEISFLALKTALKMVSDGISSTDALKSLEDKRKELINKRNEILKSNNCSDAAYKEYNCIKCKDTGFIDGKTCSCYDMVLKKVISDYTKNFCDITIDFEKDIFDNFNLNWYSKNKNEIIDIIPYDNMKSVLCDCRKFCFDFDKNYSNLYFYGSSGTGKTFMTKCIANELFKMDKTVIYQSAYKLFQFLEDYKFGRLDRDEAEKQLNSIYNSDLLIIDDLGTEFTTAYTCSVFFDILNTRLSNKKSIIISTNLNVNDLKGKYTERVASRIIGEFELMAFAGDDIRIKKKIMGDKNVTCG